MASKRPKPVPRKPRADAQRNRARILKIAKDAFTRSGANISLDDVARQARIGAGTLYRHFPTRDSLLEAVYRTEVERLAAADREFAESMPPVEALRAWMLLFVDYIATKQIIAPALNKIVGGPSKLFETTGAQIKGAINSLVKRAIESGDIEKAKAATALASSALDRAANNKIIHKNNAARRKGILMSKLAAMSSSATKAAAAPVKPAAKKKAKAKTAKKGKAKKK